MSRRTLLWIIAGFFILCAGIVIAQMSLDVLALNETAVSAESQELQGIQGADETTMVVQKTKMNKSGAAGKKAAGSLDSIHKQKLQQYKVINGALDTQKKLYAAQRANDSSASRLSTNLKKEIPQAKDALKKLRKLTDQEVALIKSSTKDAQAIKVAEASYASWKSAVDNLKEQPLSDNEMKTRNAAIRKNSDIAITNAHEQAKQVKSNELAPEDKNLLKTNVVANARTIFTNLEQIMSQMQSVMKSLSGGAGPAGIDMNAIQGLAGSFEGMAKHMQGFLGNFGPFAQTVGSLVGETVSVPKLAIPDFSSMLNLGKGSSPLPGMPSLPTGKFKSPF